MTKNIKKVVLAYSGGLDTSAMLLWIKETYGAEVVCFCADVGQGEELDGLEEKALKTGASKLYVEDLREDFVKEVVWTAVKANARYEGENKSKSRKRKARTRWRTARPAKATIRFGLN